MFTKDLTSTAGTINVNIDFNRSFYVRDLLSRRGEEYNTKSAQRRQKR